VSVNFDGQLLDQNGRVLAQNVRGTGIAVPGPPPQRWNGLLELPEHNAEIVIGNQLRLVLADGRSLDVQVTDVLPKCVRIHGTGVLPF
jgi:hypothetical protein